MKKLTKKELWTDVGIIGCLAILIGMAMSGLSYLSFEWFNTFESMLAPTPSTFLRGISTVISINEFGGEATFSSEFVSDQYFPMLINSIVSLIITFVLVPFLFIKALQTFQKGKRNVIYYAGTSLMVLVLLVQITILPISLISSSKSWNSAAQSEEIDMARKHLAEAAFIAAEKLIMDYDAVYSGDMDLQRLQDLGSNLTANLQEIDNMDTDRFDIVINREASDSTLVMHLVLDQESDKPDVQNINGETGKKELVIEVDPKKDRFFTFIKSNPN